LQGDDVLDTGRAAAWRHCGDVVQQRPHYKQGSGVLRAGRRLGGSTTGAALVTGGSGAGGRAAAQKSGRRRWGHAVWGEKGIWGKIPVVAGLPPLNNGEAHSPLNKFGGKRHRGGAGAHSPCCTGAVPEDWPMLPLGEPDRPPWAPAPDAMCFLLNHHSPENRRITSSSWRGFWFQLER
jgi:hypothetical protein